MGCSNVAQRMRIRGWPNQLVNSVLFLSCTFLLGTKAQNAGEALTTESGQLTSRDQLDKLETTQGRQLQPFNLIAPRPSSKRKVSLTISLKPN